jgi:hypothetical protein
VKAEHESRAKASNSDRVAIIGIVYSLIRQLLQFQRATPLTVRENLKKLDGTQESWSKSLAILSELLRNTPVLQYCVIDGLNLLEFNDGFSWCEQLVDALLDHHNSEQRFMNLLFSTDGQSRVLGARIPVSNRYNSTKKYIEVTRRGERLNSTRRN